MLFYKNKNKNTNILQQKNTIYKWASSSGGNSQVIRNQLKKKYS
jgi:hypothetical protein